MQYRRNKRLQNKKVTRERQRWRHNKKNRLDMTN